MRFSIFFLICTLAGAADTQVQSLVRILYAPASMPEQRVAAAKQLRATNEAAARALQKSCEETRKDFADTKEDIGYLGMLLTNEVPIMSQRTQSGTIVTSRVSRPDMTSLYQILSYFGEIVNACHEAGVTWSVRDQSNSTQSHSSHSAPAYHPMSESEFRKRQEALEREKARLRAVAQEAIRACRFGAFSACGEKALAPGATQAYLPHFFPRNRVLDAMKTSPTRTANTLNRWLSDGNWYKIVGIEMPGGALSPNDFEALTAILRFYPEVIPTWESLEKLAIARPVYFLGRNDYRAATVGEVFRVNNRLACVSCPGYGSKSESDNYLTKKEWSAWDYEGANLNRNGTSTVRQRDRIGYRRR